jgi:hypothetical protein
VQLYDGLVAKRENQLGRPKTIKWWAAQLVTMRRPLRELAGPLRIGLLHLQKTASNIKTAQVSPDPSDEGQPSRDPNGGRRAA